MQHCLRYASIAIVLSVILLLNSSLEIEAFSPLAIRSQGSIKSHTAVSSFANKDTVQRNYAVSPSYRTITHLHAAFPFDANAIQGSLGELPFMPNGEPTLLTGGLVLAALAAVAALVSQQQPQGPLITESTLQALTRQTFLQDKPLTCVYRATRDGWSALNFHEAVDGRGCALVVARTRTGALFGGYNPVGWRSTDDYYTSSAAFLWCPTSSSSQNTIQKFPVLPGGNAAIFDYATSGPCFGAQDLVLGPPRAPVMGGFAGPDMENVSLNAGNLRQGRASVGGTYDVDRSWTVRGDLNLVQVEVYCNARVGRL
jgi:hypothetical protein